MQLLARLCLVLSFLGGARCSCPSQCTCDSQGRSDGWESRSVLCNDLDMNEVPTHFPVDTVKLRIEKTVIQRIPAEAFYYLVELQYLWLAYNSVASVDHSSFYNLKQLHELRLDGNSLTTFPWASLMDMPRLRTLDLHNNRITNVPQEMVRYLKNLTYLDLSSNRLATLPPNFLDSWSHSDRTPSRSLELSRRRIVLDKSVRLTLPYYKIPLGPESRPPQDFLVQGLQDNPWFCNCHISKVIELSKVADPTVVLLDPQMVCSEPEQLEGILFQRAELEQCLKPSVMISATKITSALGSNVLLRCDATGYPTPQLMWTRSDSSPVNYTVIQDSPREGVRWSVISLTGISHQDAGNLKCKAKNLAGMSEAVVTVTVVGVTTTTTSSDTSERNTREHQEQELLQGPRRLTPPTRSRSSPWLSSSPSSFPTSLSASASPPPTAASLSQSPFFSAASSTTMQRTSNLAGTTQPGRPAPQPHPGVRGNEKVKLNGKKLPPISARKKEELALLDQAAPMETNMIEDLRVLSGTEDSVTLTWSTMDATHESEVTVLYSRDGEKDVLLLDADSSKNQVTVEGLEPGRQYVACVCPKGAAPQKARCITFSTNRVKEGAVQWSLIIAVTSVACVVTLPLLCFLLYKVCKLQRVSESLWEEELAKETYVQFETLSPMSQSIGEFWTQRHGDDSEKLLLCSRSSVESQMNLKREGSRPEYYC